MADYNQQIDQLVDQLGCSIAEAMQILRDDEVIDKGKERTAFDLTPEEEKKAIKYANSDTKKKSTTYTFTKRCTRKESATKKSIIKELAEVLKELGYENVCIFNDQKFVYFMCGKDIYHINLTQATPKTYNKTLEQIKEFQSKNEHSNI